MAHPRPLFLSVPSNKKYNFYNEKCEKMAIQYQMLVFEPATFEQVSPPITTGPGFPGDK